MGGGAAELCFVVFVLEGCALSAASLSLSLFLSLSVALPPELFRPVVNENSLHSTGGLAGSG